jgi:hypothetical protein
VASTPFLSGVFRTVGMRVPIIMTVHVFTVSMFPRSVRMPMPSKNNKSGQVRREAQAADNQDKLGVADLGRVDEPGEGFEDDGYAKGDEEYGVEEGT